MEITELQTPLLQIPFGKPKQCCSGKGGQRHDLLLRVVVFAGLRECEVCEDGPAPGGTEGFLGCC